MKWLILLIVALPASCSPQESQEVRELRARVAKLEREVATLRAVTNQPTYVLGPPQDEAPQRAIERFMERIRNKPGSIYDFPTGDFPEPDFGQKWIEYHPGMIRVEKLKDY